MISETEQERRVVRSEFWTRFFILFVTVALVASVSLQTYLTVQEYQREGHDQRVLRSIKAQAKENGRIGAEIRSCTRPGGKCYQRNQERSAGVVGDISRVVVLAAACATEADPRASAGVREAAITACVTRELARGS